MAFKFALEGGVVARPAVNCGNVGRVSTLDMPIYGYLSRLFSEFEIEVRLYETFLTALKQGEPDNPGDQEGFVRPYAASGPTHC